MSDGHTRKRTVEWVLHERAATWDQARRLRECLDAGRHASVVGVTMEAQLQALDEATTVATGTLRYCRHCWSVFGPDGKMFTPSAGGAQSSRGAITAPGQSPSTRSEET